MVFSTVITFTNTAALIHAEPPAWTTFLNGGHPAGASDLPTQWSPTENIAWTADISGYGQSSPIVAHDQIVVTSTSGEKKDNYHVAAFSVRDGGKKWQVDLENPSPFANTPMVSRAAPTAIATENGFVAFLEGGIVVAISASGEIQWKKDLVDSYGKIEARHGLSASLEKDQDRIYVWVERAQDPYVLALDPKTGEEIWKVPGIGSTSWASPRLLPIAGGEHLVCSGSGMIVGLDPKTGERLWQFGGIANNTSCTPAPVGEGQFLIGASDGRGETAAGAAAASNGLIEVAVNDEGTFEAKYKWQAEKATSSFGSPVVAGNTAAFVNRAGVLYRLDLKTGEQVSVSRTNAGGIWATPLVAGGNIYLFGSKGTTSVISLADGKQIAENRCWETGNENPEDAGPPRGSIQYAAAAAEDLLIIRRGDKLFAIGSKN